VNQQFHTPEDIIADESFQAWYLGHNDAKSDEWEALMQDHPEYQELIDIAVEQLNEFYVKEKDVDSEQVDRAHVVLMKRIASGNVVRMKHRRSWSIAVAALLVLGLGAALWIERSRHHSLSSSYGQISEYKLPDGSTVTLNANSYITLNKGWEVGKDREIWLTGEAYFKVKKTPEHSKFVVHANAMDIIVTGTQFNVVNRDHEANVFLAEGSVTLKTTQGKVIYMKPGDFVALQNNVPEKTPATGEKVLAWKEAKLYFDKTPMKDVAAKITQYYGIKVVFADSSVEEKTIGGVMPNDNLDALIQGLDATGEFLITKKDDQLIISNPQ
jgi:transmembrane sensor